MKVLQLYYKVPFPADDGGAVSILSTTKSLLAAGCELTILAMNQTTNPAKFQNIPSEFIDQTNFKMVMINNKVTLLGAVSSFIRNQCYFVSRFNSVEYKKELEEILRNNRFDIIELEHLCLFSYIKTIRYFSDAKIVLRSQNIEHQIWKNSTAKIANPLVRIWLRLEVRKLKKIEDNSTKLLDGILCLAEEDTAYFKNLSKTIQLKTIPVGIEKPNGIDRENKSFGDEIKFYHLGSMDWRPNIEGVTWFFKEVIPTLKSNFRNISFHFAGKNMSLELLKINNDKNIFVQSRISDASQFLQDKHVLIVPLLSGSGVRIKILEALSHGKTIISTSVGTQGIDSETKKYILIANTPEEFKEQFQKLIDHFEFYLAASEIARNLTLETYSIPKLGLEYVNFYKLIL